MVENLNFGGGIVHIWNGDNDVMPPKNHLYHEIVGFGCPNFKFADLQCCIDNFVEKQLEICSSHIKLGWKKIRYNSRGKCVSSKDSVILCAEHFIKFKDNLFNDLIEMGIFIYSSLVYVYLYYVIFIEN